MKTLEQEWTEIRERFSPAETSKYVEKGLERMYFGKAPTLSALSEGLEEKHYEYLIGTLITDIFTFAGIKESFAEDVMNTLAHTIRIEYPWLRITELMHFVYLFRLGQFDKFYGKPNASTLMQMLRQYIKGDRERIRAELLEKQRREREYLERQQAMGLYEGSATRAAEIELMAREALGEEARAKSQWRMQPWGTAMARAFFVDKILPNYPGDMEEREQRQWASENAAYVKAHPNLNREALQGAEYAF